MGESCSLILFTKPALPGRVKSRLIGELTASEAADVHAAFRDDLLERLEGGAYELSIAWAVEPGESVPAGAQPAFAQQGRDLGERLFNALSRLSEAHPFVAAVGSDHPLLGSKDVDEAFARLARGADLVLGPASDGGYYLIAVRRERLAESLFESVAWSTGRVLEQTLERSAALGLRTELLAEASDVDTPADLRRLVQALGDDPALDCPRTRSLLRRWGRLEPAR